MKWTPEELEKRVKKSVTAGKELSTLWSVVQKVREITSSQHASVKELVKVIGADAVLTSKVLRLVNSAAYGFSGRISNIDQAIVILGFQQLRDLCVGLTQIRGIGSPGDPLLTPLIPGTLDSLKFGEYEMGQLLRDLDHEYQTLDSMFEIMLDK